MAKSVSEAFTNNESIHKIGIIFLTLYFIIATLVCFIVTAFFAIFTVQAIVFFVSAIFVCGRIPRGYFAFRI